MGGKGGCFGEEEGGGYGGAADVVVEGCEEDLDFVGGGGVVGHHCVYVCVCISWYLFLLVFLILFCVCLTNYIIAITDNFRLFTIV